MALIFVQVGIHLQNWSHVVNYIIKAESTPDYTEVIMNHDLLIKNKIYLHGINV